MIDGIKLKISPGNSKIGGVPNLSLPPIVTCNPDIQCGKDCYARGAYARWPNVKTAWDSNLKLYREDPKQFFNDLCLFLTVESPPRFRLFVGGDFPDHHFFYTIMDIIASYRETSVLCFTKQYDFVEPFVNHISDNFKIIISTWPGMEVPEIAEYMPTSWLSCDERAPLDKPHVRCPGNCAECDYLCWDAVSVYLPVIFDKH